MPQHCISILACRRRSGNGASIAGTDDSDGASETNEPGLSTPLVLTHRGLAVCRYRRMTDVGPHWVGVVETPRCARKVGRRLPPVANASWEKMLSNAQMARRHKMLVCDDPSLSSKNPSWVLFLVRRHPSHGTKAHLPTPRNPPAGRIEHRVAVQAKL